MKVLRSLSKTLLFLSVMLAGQIVYGQDSTVIEVRASHLITPKLFDISEVNLGLQSFKSNTAFTRPLSPSLPSFYKTEHLALFCRLEEQVAQKSNVNMRFRLGSLDYVDQLEQKPHTSYKVKQ